MRTFLLVAALSASAPGAASAAGIKDLLDQAAVQVAALESLAALTAPPSSLGPRTSVGPEEAAAYCAASPMTVATLNYRDRDLLFSCAAFVKRDPEFCRTMPGAFLTSRVEIITCLVGVEQLSLFLDVMTPGEESHKGCVAGNGTLSPHLTLPERESMCTALATEGDVTARCTKAREMVPRPFTDVKLKDCTDHLTYLMTGKGCENFHPVAIQRVLCPAFARFRTTMSNMDAGDCQSDYLCRALMGDAKACETELAVRVSSACSSVRTSVLTPEPATPAPPALRREMEKTVAWAVFLPVLDAGDRAALFRLHHMLLGSLALDPETAVADMLTLRSGNIGELLYRAGQISGAGADSPDGRALEALRRRTEEARKHLAPSH